MATKLRLLARTGPTGQARRAERTGPGDHVAAAEAAAVGLRAVGPHLALAPEDDEACDAAARALLTALQAVPAVADTLLVAAAAPDVGPALRACLPRLAGIARQRGVSRLVFAASGLGTAGAAGQRPAEQIAQATGLAVVAPDGVVRLHDSGALTVIAASAPRRVARSRRGPADAAPPSWWVAEPGRAAYAVGPQWPAEVHMWSTPPQPPAPEPPTEQEQGGQTEQPDPQAQHPDPAPDATPGWTAEAVPSGLWLRPADVGDAGAVRARLRGPDPARALLLVGEAGREIPQQIWERIPELVPQLPARDDRTPPGVVVLADESERIAADARAACALYGLRWLGFNGAEAPADAPNPLPPAIPAVPIIATAAIVAATVPAVAPAPASVPTPPRSSAEPDNECAVVAPAQTPAPAAPVAPLLSPAARPRPAGARLRPPPSPRPADADRCTAEDRGILREALGPAYARLANRIDLVVTRLPSLRSAPRDELRPDLVAVLLHHGDADFPANRSALAADARADRDDRVRRAYLSCLASGLRRLPIQHGAVVIGASPAPDALDALAPGTVIDEPAAVAAAPAPDALLDAPAEFAVWSTTARRTNVFGAPGEEPEAVFPPRTRFRVLEVLRDCPDGRPRVLLRDAAPDEARTEQLDTGALRHLRPAVEKRAALLPAELRPIPGPQRFRLAPGLE